MMERQLFTFSDTGTEVRIGPAFWGQIAQTRWVRQSGDTGGSLEVMLDIDQGDTGLGRVILACGLQPQLDKLPVQATHHTDGFDTGAAQEAPFVACGDRLRVKRIATAAGAIVGRFYVWVRDP